ncbi:MAG: hypothetical protein E7073_03050 [Bacteroidales bacterium]|jgi:hypothetical protein|nr:hypothetical protein [Bacteroidales bacterium]
MKDFTQIFTLGRKAKAVIVAAAFALSMPIVSAQTNVMWGDTIFFEDFGTGTTPHGFGSFADAGLSSLNTISSLYVPYVFDETKWQSTDPNLQKAGCAGKYASFEAGHYSIVDNTNRLDQAATHDLYGGSSCTNRGSAEPNRFLVNNLKDHTTGGDGYNDAHTAVLTESPDVAAASNGRFLVVNGSTVEGMVFKRRINELCRDAEFQFSFWAARVHYDSNKKGKDIDLGCEFQFEFWAEDPGNAILADGLAAADLSSKVGQNVAMYKTAADKEADTKSYVKLLGVTAIHRCKTAYLPNMEAVRKTTVSTPNNCTTSDGAIVYTDGGSNKAYYREFRNARIYRATSGSNTSYATNGSIVVGSNQLKPCLADNGTQITVTLDDDLVDDSDNNYGTDFNLYFVVTDYDEGAGEPVVQFYAFEGGDYHLISGLTQDEIDFTDTNITSSELEGYGATVTGETANLSAYTGAADQSTVYSTILTYNVSTTVEKNPQARWEKFTDKFRLTGQDYCYMVLRNAYGKQDQNDFAIDDISFVPHNNFNLTVGTGTNSAETACSDGIVTVKGNVNIPAVGDIVDGAEFTAADRTALLNYLPDFGFIFEGQEISTGLWKQLGNGIPMQVQNENTVLEINIPLSEYNLYSHFRIAVSSTTSGFAGKCVTVATPSTERQIFGKAPQFTISGDDICEETLGTEHSAVFKITKNLGDGETAACAKPWAVRVKQPDGSYKWYIPEVTGTRP